MSYGDEYDRDLDRFGPPPNVHAIRPDTLERDDPPPDDSETGGSRRRRDRRQQAADNLRAAMLHGEEITTLPPLQHLVAGWLDLDTLAVIYGRPGGGKSFLALDLALSVVTGSWWHGHAVTPGPVVYVIAEGARGFGPRLLAWKEQNRYYGDLSQVHWLPVAVNLLNPDDHVALADACATYKPVLVVIDTLARSMPGGDENASKDMGILIAGADHIRRETGACVLLVHHTGKDTTAGMRGHSSLLGALDTEIEVKNAGDGIIVVSNTKQKDHAPADPLRFGLAPAGDSVAITPYRAGLGLDEGLSTQAHATLNCLAQIALPTGVATSTWRDAAGETGISRTRFYVHQKSLVADGLVENVGTDKTPRWRPTDAPPEPQEEPDAT